MQNTFEHLLGLSAETALALLRAMGIQEVEVVPTAAPLPRVPRGVDERRSDWGEEQGWASTRVVAVKEEGRRLIVARFLVGEPGETPEELPEDRLESADGKEVEP